MEGNQGEPQGGLGSPPGALRYGSSLHGARFRITSGFRPGTAEGSRLRDVIRHHDQNSTFLNLYTWRPKVLVSASTEWNVYVSTR